MSRNSIDEMPTTVKQAIREEKDKLMSANAAPLTIAVDGTDEDDSMSYAASSTGDLIAFRNRPSAYVIHVYKVLAITLFTWGVLCVVELGCALSWDFHIGVGCSAMGGIFAFAMFLHLHRCRKSNPPRASIMCTFQTGARPWYYTMMTVLVLLILYWTFLIIVRFWGADSPGWKTFPESCADHPDHCARLAGDAASSFRVDPKIHAPRINQSLADVRDYVAQWIDDTYQTKVVRRGDGEPSFLHARILTFFFGFPDDFAVSMFCNAANQTEIWVQSQSRVGQGDLGTNPARIASFVKFMNDWDYGNSTDCGSNI